MANLTQPNSGENTPIHEENIAKVSEILLGGNIFIIPTETVYGLAANALDDKAVSKIYEAKGRPSFNPLIVHISNIEKAKEFVIVSKVAERLTKAFWPGPLTIVLPKKDDCLISNIVSAGLDTLAIRAPRHPIAQAILEKSNLPLAAPSANISGTISPTHASHITPELLKKVHGAIDGGPCDIGLESTIVKVDEDKIIILRPGSIGHEDLMEATGLPVEIYKGSDITSPGQLTRHYAPSSNLRLNAFNAMEGEVMIGFGAIDGDMNLSISGNLTEAGANLFKMLKEADAAPEAGISVAPIPFEGIGFAINDRLERAAEKEE